MADAFADWQHPRGKNGQFIEVNGQANVTQPDGTEKRGTIVALTPTGPVIKYDDGSYGVIPIADVVNTVTPAPKALAEIAKPPAKAAPHAADWTPWTKGILANAAKNPEINACGEKAAGVVKTGKYNAQDPNDCMGAEVGKLLQQMHKDGNASALRTSTLGDDDLALGVIAAHKAGYIDDNGNPKTKPSGVAHRSRVKKPAAKKPSNASRRKPKIKPHATPTTARQRPQTAISKDRAARDEQAARNQVTRNAAKARAATTREAIRQKASAPAASQKSRAAVDTAMTRARTQMAANQQRAAQQKAAARPAAKPTRIAGKAQRASGAPVDIDVDEMLKGTYYAGDESITAGIFDKVKSVFNEWQHPRDSNGQFIQIGAVVNVDMPFNNSSGSTVRRGTVTGIDRQGVEVSWDGGGYSKGIKPGQIEVAPRSIAEIDAMGERQASDRQDMFDYNMAMDDNYESFNVSESDFGRPTYGNKDDPTWNSVADEELAISVILNKPMGSATAVGRWKDMDLSDEDTAASVAAEQDALRRAAHQSAG